MSTFMGKLGQMFDFQRFEESTALQRIIDETHARCTAKALTLDEMNMIAAAGMPERKPER